MKNKLKENINSIVFLFNIALIFIVEIFYYLISNNYILLIDRLTIKLAKINILYVKLFQAFSLNNNLINEDINNKLMEFTDNVPWKVSEIDYETLFKISDKYNINMENYYPINSGMISIVFKGFDKINNKNIIIKIKRKNIENNLDVSIKNVLFLVNVLSFINIINKYQINEIINKNIDILKKQTNFLQEVDNMLLIRENCKNLKYIKIPNVNKNITEEYQNVIVMELIEGIKLKNIKEEDYKEYSKQIIKFGIVTTLIHGITHGDLHCGNILFIKDNDKKYPYKLGILDFGIIYKFSPKLKTFLSDILISIFNISSRETAKKILNSVIIEPEGILNKISNEDYNNIINLTEEIITETKISYKKANQIQIYNFLSNLNKYLSKKELLNLGIKVSDDFLKLQLVLAMSQGATLKLCKGDFVNVINEVINEIFNISLISL